MTDYPRMNMKSTTFAEFVKRIGELENENSQLKTEYEKECHRADELEDSYWKSEKENQKLREELKEICEKYLKIKTTVSAYEDAYKDSNAYIIQLKELLKECKRQFEEVELCRYDVADTDQEDWFKISTEQAGIANKMIAKIDEVLK